MSSISPFQAMILRQPYRFQCIRPRASSSVHSYVSSQSMACLLALRGKTVICSPLGQFSIVTIFPVRIGDLFLSFTNSSLYLLIATGLVSLLFFLVMTEGGRLFPPRWQSVVEMTYQFVGSLVEEQIGGEGRKYFPLVLTTFLFLLSTNLVGMIPYSFTATSHLAVTFGL